MERIPAETFEVFKELKNRVEETLPIITSDEFIIGPYSGSMVFRIYPKPSFTVLQVAIHLQDDLWLIDLSLFYSYPRKNSIKQIQLSKKDGNFDSFEDEIKQFAELIGEYPAK
jgi:hypothetical protein